MKNQLSYTLRIDEELMEEFRKVAEEEKRSINSELNYIIEEYIEFKKIKSDKKIFEENNKK